MLSNDRQSLWKRVGLSAHTMASRWIGLIDRHKYRKKYFPGKGSLRKAKAEIQRKGLCPTTSWGHAGAQQVHDQISVDVCVPKAVVLT